MKNFFKYTLLFVIVVLLQVLLFNNIYKTQIAEVFDGTMFLFGVGSLLVLFGVLCLVVPRVVREPRQRGVVIQGLFRSNYVIFGVSLVTNVFGEAHAAAASMLSAVLVRLVTAARRYGTRRSVHSTTAKRFSSSVAVS